MTNLTHLTVGVALGQLLVSIDSQGLYQPHTIVLTSIFLSQLPDVNLLWKPVKDHHNDFTHIPIFWIILSVCVSVVEYFIFQSIVFGLLVASSSLLHMGMDTFGKTIGIRWFAPFYKHEFSFTKLEKDGRWLGHSSFYWEILVFICSLSVIVILL